MNAEVSRLPNGWVAASFDEAIEVVSDRGLRIKQKTYLEFGKLPVVDQGDGLIGGYTNDSSAQVDHAPPVIVFGDHTRRFKYVTFPFAVGADGVKVFAPSDLFLPKFLFLQLGTIDLEDRGYGRHYQHLRKETLLVPPRAEQIRIVEKLEELLSDLDAGVAELKAAQRKLVQYRQSLLKAAVEGALTANWRAARSRSGEPQESGADLLQRILTERRTRWEAKQLAKYADQGKTPPKGWQAKYPEPVAPDTRDLPELPEEWIWASVDQLTHFVRNGLSKTPNTEGLGLPILRINAVRPMLVQFSEFKHIDVSESEVSDYFIENGDLLATRYNGSVDLLGVFGLVRELRERMLYPDKLIRMSPVLVDTLGTWIEVAANSGASRSYVVRKVKTTAGQTGISGEDIKKMPIPLPPFQEQAVLQAMLLRQLDSTGDQLAEVEVSLKQTTAQRKNILKAAFAGQLVPQDPNDEPASVLLERIRAERANKTDTTKPRGRKPRTTA